MNSHTLAKWLSTLSAPERIRVLALIYSNLTVSARELFLPEHGQGAQSSVLAKLRGLNELHHKLAGQLIGLSPDTEKSYPVDVFSDILFETAETYGVGGFLNSAIQFAQTRERPVTK
jgi:hypothetical protein